MSYLTGQFARLHESESDATTFAVKLETRNTEKGITKGQTHWLTINARTLALIELAILAEENNG